MNVCFSQLTNLILIFSLWVCIMCIHLTNRFSQLDWCFYFIFLSTLYFSTDRFHGTLLSMQFFCYVWFDFACLKQFGFSQWDVAKSCHMLFTVTLLQASLFCRNLMLQKIVKQQLKIPNRNTVVDSSHPALNETDEHNWTITLHENKSYCKNTQSLWNSLQNQLQFVSLP